MLWLLFCGVVAVGFAFAFGVGVHTGRRFMRSRVLYLEEQCEHLRGHIGYDEICADLRVRQAELRASKEPQDEAFLQREIELLMQERDGYFRKRGL